MTLFGRCPGLAIALGLLASTVADAAVISVVAVQVNDDAIPPTDTVAVCPGDTIETEIFISDWSAAGEQLLLWQLQFDADGFLSGSTGTVLPLGYDAPLTLQECFGDEDCDTDLTCSFDCGSLADPGRCIGPDHDPVMGAFMDSGRPDYVYAGSVSLPAVDTCSPGPNYRYGSLYFSGPEPVYDPPPKYGGTLILEASKDASGTFSIAIDPGKGTFMKDENRENIEPIELLPLTVDISAGDGPPCRVAGSDPPNCAIDPGQPSAPDGTGVAGWDRLSLRFSDDARMLTANDFDVDDLTPSPPQIEEIIASETGETLTLVFDRRIRLGRWTCVTYLPRPKTTCIGSLPGDVGGDGTHETTDIALLVDHLNGSLAEPLPTWRCDVNRSGKCTGADLLRAIDLRHGGDAYDNWLGRTIFPAACPSEQ